MRNILLGSNTPARCRTGLAFLIACTLAVAASMARAQCIEYSESMHWVAHAPGSAWGVTVSGSTAYVADQALGLELVDISDPERPRVRGIVTLAGDALGVAVSGDHAYVACDEPTSLQVVDISDPAAPRVVGSVATPGYAWVPAVSGHYVFLAAETSGMLVVDVSDPTDPRIVGGLDTPDSTWTVVVVGSIAYLTCGASLLVVDIADPTAPRILGSVPTPREALGLAAAGGFAYLTDGNARLHVLDLSVPQSPRIVGSVSVPDGSWVVGDGSRAYVTGGSTLQVVDVSDPSAPAVLGRIDAGGLCFAAGISGNHALVAVYDLGLEVFNVASGHAPQMLGSADTPGEAWKAALFGGVPGATKGKVPAYACVADFFSGVQVVDVTDPAGPILLGGADTPGFARDVAMLGSHAVIADDDAGLRMIDLSDPARPRATVGLALAGKAWGVALSGSTAFVAADGAGLQVVDLADPDSPRVIGRLDAEAQAWCVAVAGGRAYLGDGSALRIVNVAEPDNPRELGRIALPGYVMGIAVSGRYAYIADDDGGLVIVDVLDPARPVVAGSGAMPAGARCITVADGVVYVTGGFSVQVVDVSDPARPKVIGTVTASSPRGVTVAGGLLYLADGGSGLDILPAQCTAASDIGAFPLLGPADGDTVHTHQPEVHWRRAPAAGDPARYTIVWSERSDFRTADSTDTGIDTTYAFQPDAVRSGATVYWRVRARSMTGTQRWADPPGGWSFFFLEDDTPVRILPAASASDDGILVSWTVLDGTGLTACRVERRTAGDAAETWAPVSPLLGGPEDGGREWRFLDSDAEPDVEYLYIVEGFGPLGPAGRFGPVTARRPRGSFDLRVEPNPSAGASTTRLSLPRAGDALLRVLDVQGREAARRTLSGLRAGVHRIAWDGCDMAGRPLPSGTYLVVVESASERKAVRWVILR